MESFFAADHKMVTKENQAPLKKIKLTGYQKVWISELHVSILYSQLFQNNNI